MQRSKAKNDLVCLATKDTRELFHFPAFGDLDVAKGAGGWRYLGSA